jgi:Carboxypeptidase regulatory-like domain
MRRTLVLLGLLIVALAGVWGFWSQDEKRPPVRRDAPAVPAAKETEAVGGIPATERVSAEDPDASAPAAAGRLVVQCVARSNQRPLSRVRVRAKYDDDGMGYGLRGPERASSGRPGEELLTDDEGRATFEVESGRALRVSANDLEHFVSREESGVVPALSPGETRAFRLEHDAGETARFCGLVVARESGVPLGNAEVCVNGKPRTTTDAAGRFELDYASHLVPGLRIDARGFGPAAVAAGPGYESAERARRIALERAGSLVIALHLPETQAVARVTLRAKGYEIMQDQVFSASVDPPDLEWEATADAHWVCRFAELPPNVGLVADVTGSTGLLFHAAEPIVLAPGETRRLEWDLRGCDLVGHVFEEDGKVAPGIMLWLLRAEPGGFRSYLVGYRSNDVVGRATSGEDGSFRFRAVAPGAWILGPEPKDLQPGVTPGDAIAPSPIEVTVRPGEPQISVDVHLVRGLYIRGRLVAPDGTTGVQGSVFATSSAGDHLQAGAAKDGVFTLGPLARGTFSLQGVAYQTYCRALAVAAQAGASDVVLRLRQGGEVAGRVIDGESGAGVVAAITVGGEDDSWTIRRTEADGSFRFDGLEPGRYTLFASTTAGQAGELPGVVLDAATPAKGLEVVLKRGARLRIRYEGRGIAQASVRRNGASIAGDGIEGGKNATWIVTPGRMSVHFRYPGIEKPEVQDVEIAPGDERELVFKAPR